DLVTGVQTCALPIWLQYDHPLGLCLVAAARGSVIPLKETLDQPETTWLQWRRRLDKVQPFCRVTSHTSEEVREILASLETVFRRSEERRVGQERRAG